MIGVKPFPPGMSEITPSMVASDYPGPGIYASRMSVAFVGHDEAVMWMGLSEGQSRLLLDPVSPTPVENRVSDNALDSDTFLKALAIAQNPSLAKDLV